MNRSYYLLGGMIAAAIVVLAVFLFMPSPSPVKPASPGQANAPQPRSSVLGQGTVVASSTASSTGAASPSKTEEQVALDDGSPSGKEKSLERIHEAMVTYSEEGLPVIKPYLSHPDSEVRVAAIDAVINLAVPAGADVLRQASKTARNSEEQIKMIQGADFLELPRIPLDLLKQILEQKQAARAAGDGARSARPGAPAKNKP